MFYRLSILKRDTNQFITGRRRVKTVSKKILEDADEIMKMILTASIHLDPFYLLDLNSVARMCRAAINSSL